MPWCRCFRTIDLRFFFADVIPHHRQLGGLLRRQFRRVPAAMISMMEFAAAAGKSALQAHESSCEIKTTGRDFVSVLDDTHLVIVAVKP